MCVEAGFSQIQSIIKGKPTGAICPSIFHQNGALPSVPKYWSNEETMIKYVNKIFVQYVEKISQLFDEDKPAVVLMDNFKIQITEAITEILERHRISTCFVPANASY